MSIMARQAIVTKQCGYRIKATAARGYCYFNRRDDLNRDENHVEAAKKLIAKFVAEDVANYPASAANNPWQKPFVTGNLPNGDYVHVFMDDDSITRQ